MLGGAMAERGTSTMSRLRSSSVLHRDGNRTGAGRRCSTIRSPKPKPPAHIQITEPISRTESAGPSIYLGSYARDKNAIPSLHRKSTGSIVASSRTSVNHLQLEPLLQGVDENTETYGIHETRDGFFDATFRHPPQRSRSELFEKASQVLPVELKRDRSNSFAEELVRQWSKLVAIVLEVTTTRAGVRLLKSFLGIFVCYVTCLIPAARGWLGNFYYIITVSALINHPGRSVGSQIDGFITSTSGVIIGLLWGSLAVFTTTATPASIRGYGAAVVPFVFFYSLFFGWLRCVLNRFWQGIIAAGISFFYTCLAQDFALPVPYQAQIWSHFTQFLIPWVLGQAACFIVCVSLFPAAGNRPMALAFHSSLISIRSSLVLPRTENPDLNRDLSWHFVQLSQAVRDFMLDLSFSRFTPDDTTALRNLLQGVLRAMLAVKPDTNLFNTELGESGKGKASDSGDSQAAKQIASSLSPPTRKLISASKEAITHIDSVLIKMSGIFGFADTEAPSLQDLNTTLQELREAEIEFDEANTSLAGVHALTSRSAERLDILEFYLFVNPIRGAAEKICDLLAKVVQIVDQQRSWHINLPSYPWKKASFRMNPTVRHDRGGATAASYFQSKRQLGKMMDELQNRSWAPLKPSKSMDSVEMRDERPLLARAASLSKVEESERKKGLRYHLQLEVFLHDIWSVLHRLQDFETRFALKKSLVCTLLSIPAFLPQSSSWWFAHDSWWAVVTVWIMMHPRVGGNVQDLFVRTFCAALGAVWAGVAHAAGSGNPYVTAVFAAIFLYPMLYRYTLSNHPRSGILGCLSFLVISLIIVSAPEGVDLVQIAWTRGMAFVIGCVTSIIVNWVLWPFIARHELRKSISNMILHCAILYRSIIAKYMYYNRGEAPTSEDIMNSEMLEGRLRENFVRIRQLMGLTQHEIRLRAPFDPVPYSALIDTCEQFFNRLVEVRQGSLSFAAGARSRMMDENSSELLACRRDAVATILMNMYTLAGAIRSQRPLPRYLPSSALARQRLVDMMELIEAEEAEGDPAAHQQRMGWQEVYRYAYSGALTDIVAQVQQLEAYTRAVVGEIGLYRPNNQID